MTTLTKLSLCGFPCQKTVLSRDGSSQVKFNPLSPNYVSCRRSRGFKFNQLPLTYERASLVKHSPIIRSSQSPFPLLAAAIVPKSVEELMTTVLLSVGIYHLVSGVIGVMKFIASRLINHLLFALKLIREWQIARKAAEKNIPLKRKVDQSSAGKPE